MSPAALTIIILVSATLGFWLRGKIDAAQKDLDR